MKVFLSQVLGFIFSITINLYNTWLQKTLTHSKSPEFLCSLQINSNEHFIPGIHLLVPHPKWAPSLFLLCSPHPSPFYWHPSIFSQATIISWSTMGDGQGKALQVHLFHKNPVTDLPYSWNYHLKALGGLKDNDLWPLSLKIHLALYLLQTETGIFRYRKLDHIMFRFLPTLLF